MHELKYTIIYWPDFLIICFGTLFVFLFLLFFLRAFSSTIISVHDWTFSKGAIGTVFLTRKKKSDFENIN